MKAITRQELEQLLESQRGATFVTILANTEPDWIRPKSNPMARLGVRKSAKVNGMINWSYRNAVDNQRARENQPLNAAGEVEWFEPEPRRWGVRLHDIVGRLLPTVLHVTKKGEERKYLELKVQNSLGHSFYDRDNNRIPNEEVYPWIREKVEGRRQEVDEPVILRDYGLENIRAIRLNGELYVVQN